MKNLLLLFAVLFWLGCSKDTVNPTQNGLLEGTTWKGIQANGTIPIRVDVSFQANRQGVITASDGNKSEDAPVANNAHDNFKYSFDGSKMEISGSDLAKRYLEGDATLADQTLIIKADVGTITFHPL